MLTKWPLNVHMAMYKLLYVAFVRKQHCLPFSESLMAMMAEIIYPDGRKISNTIDWKTVNHAPSYQ